MENEDQDYWNVSLNRSFNFDEDTTFAPIESRSERLLSYDDERSSEVSYDYSQSSEMPLHLIISDDDLKEVLEDQVISDINILPKNIKLEDEVKVLRRQLQEFNYAPVSLTISKLLMGKSCSLHIYRSLKDKEALLDEAIASGNGDAILQVVLFIQSSLKKRIFHDILKTRPEAVTHYINYLITRVRLGEVSEILMMLGRSQEAALVQFQATASMSSANIEFKKQRLKKLYSDLFSTSTSNSFYSVLVGNYVTLLEMQISERLHFQPADIVDKSVVETLFHVCEKFKWSEANQSSNTMTNPYKLSETYQLLPATFEWVAITERGKCQAWRDVESLFEKKAWYNLKQKSFTIHIPIEKAILQLHNLGAPQAILNKFLAQVDDPNRKLALAKKVEATHSIVDALVALKDKNELEHFRDRLESGTESRFYAENALKNMNSKWIGAIK